MDAFSRLATVTDRVRRALDGGAPSPQLRRDLDLAFAGALDALEDEDDEVFCQNLVRCYRRLMERLDDYERLAA
jgi:hypothetical protein